MAALIDPPAVPPLLAGDCALVSVVVPGVRGMPADAFTAATETAYHALRRRAIDAGRPHLVRVWNYVPDLLAPAGDGTNRYMAFNAGRFAAMREWYGDRLAELAPAGTGVGNPGDELVLHAWAASSPGVAVQNPRQTPATSYSPRYGPRPPCFARATRVGRVLLVSGTAGITGEDTASPDDLVKQLDLTFTHLATLAGSIGDYRSLRAYVPRMLDLALVRARLTGSGARTTEAFVTDLCRPELRVEIEGIAVESEPR